MSAVLPSMRRRLGRVLGLYSVLSAVAVAAAVSLVVRHEVGELMDAALREAAQILHGTLQGVVPAAPVAAGGVMPAAPHPEELIWQIVDPSGRVLLRSHQAPAAALAPPGLRGFADHDGGWRVHAMPFDAQGRRLLVAQTAAERQEAKVEAGLYSAAAALLVALACAAGLRPIVRRELAPIVELSAAVQRFDPLQPGDHGFPPAQREELRPVREAIADLGQRLARRVASERAVSAHAAHALRTPLAGLVAQLAAGQRLAPEALQPRLASARQAADRLRRVVDALLALFRTGAAPQRRPVQLAELLQPLGGGVITLGCRAAAPVLADPDLLSAALANLLDNSVRHGARSAQVELARVDGQDVVTLSDDGPGIDEAKRARLQAALDAQAYEHVTGLGLMLADLVARAHGGRLSLPPSAGGAVVRLSLGPAELSLEEGRGRPEVP